MSKKTRTKNINDTLVSELEEISIEELDLEMNEFYIDDEKINSIKAPSDMKLWVRGAIDKAEVDMKKHKRKKQIIASAASIAVVFSIGVYNPVLAHKVPFLEKVLKSINDTLKIDEISYFIGLDKIAPKATLDESNKVKFIKPSEYKVNKLYNEGGEFEDEVLDDKEGKQIQEPKTEYLAVQFIHKMSNSIINPIDGRKYGSIKITPKTIELAINGLELIESDEDRKHLYNELNKWKNGKFENAVDVHNYVWYMLDGEIGKAISDEVEQGFLNECIIFTGKYQGLRPMTFQNIVATQMGTCLEKSTYKIAALRANGIPAALNMVPCWGNSQYPHSWVEIIGSKQFGMIYDNTQRPFLTKDDIKIDGMFWRDVYQSKIDMFPSTITIQYCRTAPKVYRYNYRIQPHSLAILSKEEIPPLFKNPGIQDITDQYVVCEDIEVPLWNEKHPKEYVYLCCYDIIGWNPVCWGRPEGSKVRFPKMGVNMLYLPAYYNDGEIRPAGDAFILTREGKLRKLLPDFEKAESSATFYSKVPYRMNTALQAAGTIGTRFYVCNKKDLSDRSLIYSIENPPFYVDSFRISVSQKYRYLICDFQETQPLGYFYAIAEIKVFGGDGQQFSGEWGGNEGTKGHGLDLVTDQDRVSYYQPDQFQKDQFVVLDLGEPKQIAKVEFYPRNDDNKIVTGELYELFYWDKKWISLGKQYAEDNKLIYQNIPRESIFRIHNHTRGKEHRPFTYEGGKQVWY